MIYIYRILIFPIFFILFLKNCLKFIRRGGYFSHIKHYFGCYNLPPKTAKKRLWIQAVSVGEVNAISELVKQLSDDFEIFLTTTSSTGYKIIEQKLQKYCIGYGFFSLDFWFAKKISLKTIQPDAIILAESELWPEHIYQAKANNLPIFLINARLSHKSFLRYKKFPKLTNLLLKNIDHILASSAEYQNYFQQLTTTPVEYFGNMKFDKNFLHLTAEQREILKKEFGFLANSLVVTGCSTWPQEEEMLLNIVKNINNHNKNLDVRLLLIPRHAERAPEIVELLNKNNVQYIQRSKVLSGNIQENSNDFVDVYLADTTGEMSRLIQVSDVCVVGKSFYDNHCGQSPLDAAAAGIPIFYGNNMENFRDICESLENNHLAQRISNPQELESEILNLLNNPEKRQDWSDKLLAWYQKNQGATTRTVEYIKQRF